MRNASFALALASFAACTTNQGTTPTDDPLAGENAADDGGKSDQAAHDTMGYLAVTKVGCAAGTSPLLCAPYRLSRPNRSTIMCNDNKYHSSCTVKAINYSALGLSQDQEDAIEAALDAQHADSSIGTQVLIRGTYKIYVDFLAFEASEVWMAQLSHGSTDTGTFVMLSDSNIRCITAPCPTIREEKLNSTRLANIEGIDFGSNIDSRHQKAIDKQELTAQGVIVVGIRTESPGPTDKMMQLRSVDQAFFPVTAH